jgi:hypothetical protein
LCELSDRDWSLHLHHQQPINIKPKSSCGHSLVDSRISRVIAVRVSASKLNITIASKKYGENGSCITCDSDCRRAPSYSAMSTHHPYYSKDLQINSTAEHNVSTQLPTYCSQTVSSADISEHIALPDHKNGWSIAMARPSPVKDSAVSVAIL